MMKQLAPILLWLSLCFAALLYINANYPHLLKSLNLESSVPQMATGSAEEQSAESQRRAYINSLPISNDKKEMLMRRQVFLGAGKPMVESALDKPDTISMRREGSDVVEYWTYSFSGRRPGIVLEFRNSLLVGTRATSVSDSSQDTPKPAIPVQQQPKTRPQSSNTAPAPSQATQPQRIAAPAVPQPQTQRVATTAPAVQQKPIIIEQTEPVSAQVTSSAYTPPPNAPKPPPPSQGDTIVATLPTSGPIALPPPPEAPAIDTAIDDLGPAPVIKKKKSYFSGQPSYYSPR